MTTATLSTVVRGGLHTPNRAGSLGASDQPAELTTVHLGAVSFTNTVPLVQSLMDHPQTVVVGGPPQRTLNLDLKLAPPAALAAAMHAGQFDVALIPVVEHLRARHYRLIAPVGICSRGAVSSVMIYCRRPARSVDTLAVDCRSRTSVALSVVWFAKALNRRPELIDSFDPTHAVPRPQGGLATAADRADAVLVIGDANWAVPPSGWADVIDLGEAWHSLTGLGFVYAGWSARPDLPAGVAAAVGECLVAAKLAGVGAIASLAPLAAARAGVPTATVETYLTRHIRYDVEAPEQAGLELFARWCEELGLLSGGPSV